MIKYIYDIAGIIEALRGNNRLSRKTDKKGDINEKKSGRVMRWAGILCPVLIAAAVAGYMIYSSVTGNKITVAELVGYAPAHASLAALALLVIYVLKSLSVVFPVTVLYAAGGYIFGPVLGCIVNAAGIAVGCAVQYWMGRASGSHTAERLADKHPRMRSLFGLQDRSPFFAALSARLFGVISGDIISYYFGASGLKFLPFLAGSIIGVLPGLVTVTVLGTSATDPRSPEFIISVAAVVLIFGLSALGKHIIDKKRKTGEKNKNEDGDKSL